MTIRLKMHREHNHQQRRLLSRVVERPIRRSITLHSNQSYRDNIEYSWPNYLV